MTKAILVIDMPKNCGECILANEDYDVCQATQKSISYDERGYGIECPLKPMPEKKPKIKELPQYTKEYEAYCKGEVDGWNECIDSLL